MDLDSRLDKEISRAYSDLSSGFDSEGIEPTLDDFLDSFEPRDREVATYYRSLPVAERVKRWEVYA